MDIKNIVEKAILKHLLTKEMPDEITISCTSKIDNHKYGIVTTVEDLAGEISSDIKKELKLDVDKVIKEGLLAKARLQSKYEKQIRDIKKELDEQGKHQEG